jgi:hypothetical protein
VHDDDVHHPKDIGDRSTLAIMLALQAEGSTIYVPFGENSRSDLVVEDGVRLIRVQCKTGRLTKGSVEFRTASSYLRHPNPKLRSRPYHGEIDAFAVFCPELGTVYVVPIDELPNRTMAMLRVEAPRNGQTKRVRQASAYEVARVSTTPTRGPGAPAGA